MVDYSGEPRQARPSASRRALSGQTAASSSPTHWQTPVYIALGSNLGDREHTICSALRDLEEQGDTRVLRCSTLHETEPVGGPPGQRRYLNAVAELATELSARKLLERLLALEGRYGRERVVPNGPRTLDLDLLLYGEQVINEPGLIVPHPKLWERRFVMQPLAEICDLRALTVSRNAKPAEPQPPARGG